MVAHSETCLPKNANGIKFELCPSQLQLKFGLFGPHVQSVENCATDIAGSSVEEYSYSPISPERLQARYGDLFTDRSGDEISRILVLEDLDLLDANGNEIPIYNCARKKVPRQKRELVPQAECAVLVNLKKADELFSFESHSPYVNPLDYKLGRQVDKYETGLLPGVGQIQTKRPFPPFSRTVKDINDTIALSEPTNTSANQPIDVDSDGEYQEPLAPTMQAVFGTSTQIYSKIMHTFAPRATDFKIDHGLATAACVGRFGTTSAHTQAHRKAAREIAQMLPHQHLEHLIDEERFDRDLRVEQVFVICPPRMKAQYRSGR
jgi:hypothetical protein